MPLASEWVVARNFLTLGAGEAVSRLIAFAAAVYLARTLGAASYGIISVAAAVMLYLVRLTDSGMELGLGVREIAVHPERAGVIAASMLTFRLLVAVALTIALGSFGFALLPQPDGAVLAVYGLTLIAAGINSRWVHLGLERSAHMAVARVAGELTMVALVLLSVRGAQDVTKAPLAQFFGDLVGALLLLWWLRRLGVRLAFRLDPAVVRPLVRRAAPLIMASLLGLAVFNGDMIFLRVFHGSAAVGYYAAAYTLISFLINIGVTYSYSLLPAMTRLGGAAQRQDLYHTAMAHVFAAAFPAAVGGYLLAPQVVELIFGAAYRPAVPALQILIWSIPLSTIRDVPRMALLASGREDRVVLTNMWSAACGILLYLLLIPRYGLMGAAAATITTEALRLIIATAYSRREGLHAARLARFWRAGAAGAVMAGVLLALPSAALWMRVALGVLGYLAALALFGGIRFRQRGLPVLDV